MSGPPLPRKIDNWSPTSVQPGLAKTGGRLIKHARHYWLPLAEGHLTRRLFARDGTKNRRLAGGDGVDGSDGRSDVRRPGVEGRRGVREMY